MALSELLRFEHCQPWALLLPCPPSNVIRMVTSWECSESLCQSHALSLSEAKMEHDSLRLGRFPRIENWLHREGCYQQWNSVSPVSAQLCGSSSSVSVLEHSRASLQPQARALPSRTLLRSLLQSTPPAIIPQKPPVVPLSMRRSRSLTVPQIPFHRKSHSVCWRLQFAFLILLLINFGLMIFSGSAYMKATQKISKIFSKLIG